MTDLLKYRQPGTGQAAFNAHTGSLLAVGGSGLGATLSAFWSLGACGLATMEPAFALAEYGWRFALQTCSL
jgi:hypothetical protein